MPDCANATPLLPCPFCGAPAELEHDGDHHGKWFNLGCSRHFGRVDPQCPGGRLWYTESLDGEASAIAAWNKRATPAERPGDAALAEAIEWLAALAKNERDDDASRIFPVSAIEHMDRIVNAYRSGALSPAPRDGGWLPIKSAPKSTSQDTPAGKFVRGIYLLGYCPDEGASPDSCIEVIWWEPNEHGGRGAWYSGGTFEVRPTHWRPLPAAPTEDGR